MWLLVKFYWQMCLLQVGPEKAPTHSVFIALVVSVFLLFNTLVRLLILEFSFLNAVLGTAVVAATMAFALWILLWFKRLTGRFKATLGAWLGQDVFLSTLALPLNVALVSQGGWEMSVILILAIYCWDLAVKGFILRKACHVGPVLGMCLALAISLGAVSMERWVLITDEVMVQSETSGFHKEIQSTQVD